MVRLRSTPPAATSRTARVPAARACTANVNTAPAGTVSTTGPSASSTGTRRITRVAEASGSRFTSSASRCCASIACSPSGSTGASGPGGAGAGGIRPGGPSVRSSMPIAFGFGVSTSMYQPGDSAQPVAAVPFPVAFSTAPSSVVIRAVSAGPSACTATVTTPVAWNSSALGPRRLNRVRQAWPGPTGGTPGEARISAEPDRSPVVVSTANLTSMAAAGSSSPPFAGSCTASQ